MFQRGLAKADATSLNGLLQSLRFQNGSTSSAPDTFVTSPTDSG